RVTSIAISSEILRHNINLRHPLTNHLPYTTLLRSGLDTVVVEKIQAASYLPDPPAVKKINLNTADEQRMAAHPYFGRKIARAIVTYRFQHGNFKSVDDLGKIPLIDKNNLGKLFPYVTVDP